MENILLLNKKLLTKRFHRELSRIPQAPPSSSWLTCLCSKSTDLWNLSHFQSWNFPSKSQVPKCLSALYPCNMLTCQVLKSIWQDIQYKLWNSFFKITSPNHLCPQPPSPTLMKYFPKNHPRNSFFKIASPHQLCPLLPSPTLNEIFSQEIIISLLDNLHIPWSKSKVISLVLQPLSKSPIFINYHPPPRSLYLHHEPPQQVWSNKPSILFHLVILI